jgi:hypothetical protein
MAPSEEMWARLWGATSLSGWVVSEQLVVGNLVTEDVVRYQTVLALGELGVGPERLVAEYLESLPGWGQGEPDGFLATRRRSHPTPCLTVPFGELVKDVIRMPFLQVRGSGAAEGECRLDGGHSDG